MKDAPRLDPLEDRIVLDGAEPEITIVPPDDPVFLGDQDVGYTLTFDNVGDEAGYVPYVDLIIPTSGRDGEGDGPSFDSASFLGSPLTATQLTFDANGEVEHPFVVNPDGTPFIVTGGNEGDTLVTFSLPYGSFSPGNPKVPVDVVIDYNPLADAVGPVPTFTVVGGFSLGEDGLDNPDVDAPIRGTEVVLQQDPKVIEITKSTNADELETATGPSYPRTYSVDIKVAPGQTITDFLLTESLPTEIVYNGNLQIAGGTVDSIVQTPTVGAQVQPGDQLIIDFSQISGTVTVTFDYYVSNDPSDSANPTNDATTGAPSGVSNEVEGQGTWDPLDPDDADVVVSDTAMLELSAKSIAIQKSNALTDDQNAVGATPGDEFTFTLNLQVSDYFTLGDVTVEDLLGDGWDYVVGSAEFYAAQESGATGSALAPLSLTPDETVSANADGTTDIAWDISQALIRNGSDGLLAGDIARDGLSNSVPADPGPPEVAAVAGTPTEVVITYKAKVRSDYTSVATGDPKVSQGDTLTNNSTVRADVRDTGNPTVATGNEITDTTSSDVNIERGAISSKSLFAVGGDTVIDPDRLVSAGDTVTFKVEYEAPLSAFENFKIIDNLPLLVFDVDQEFTASTPTVPSPSWVTTPADRSVPPAAGQAYFGPGTSATFFNQTPEIEVDGANNGLIFDFGTFTAATPERVNIEILFTTTVQDAKFAPEIFLTNQATAFETNSFGEETASIAITDFTYAEPELYIAKGVVATDNPNSTLAATPDLPGISAGDVGLRFAGTVSSGALDGAALDANQDIQDVDAGDTITFAVVVENEGGSPYGAFNVTLKDTIPDGFEIPPGGLNMSVTDGTGAAIAFTKPDGSAAVAADLFSGDGITLVDDGPRLGALSTFDENSGENIVVITYDLKVSDSATPGTTLTNTAAVTHYHAYEGNGLPLDPAAPLNRASGLEAAATASATDASVTKEVLTREFDATATERLADEVIVGETVEFLVTVTVPEGTLYETVIADEVTVGGLRITGGEVVSMGNRMTNTGGITVGSVATENNGVWSFDLGTLVNEGDNSDANDVITVKMTAVVEDASVGSAGERLRNTASLDYEDVDGTEFAHQARKSVFLAEPNVGLTKQISDAEVTAGQRVTYTVTLTNPVGARDAQAFDLTISDVLPDEMNLDTASITLTVNGAGVPLDASNKRTNVGGDPDAFDVLLDRMDPGDVVVVTYEAVVDNSVIAGAKIDNTAVVSYDSTPEDDSAGPDLDDREYQTDADASTFASAAEVDKSVRPGSSSNALTAGDDLLVGETVVFDLKIEVPEGSVADLVLTDTLPSGLAYVTSEVVRIGAGPGNPIAGASLSAGDEGSNVGQVTTFDFGDLTNAFDGVTDAKDEIIVSVTARVVDVAAARDGVALANTARLTQSRGDGTTVSHVDTAEVSVVEPELVISKTDDTVTADAGETVEQVITLRNTGTGPAYDIRLTDQVDAAYLQDVDLNAVSVVLTDGGGGAYVPAVAPVVQLVGGELVVIIDDLPVGYRATITYDAVVQDDAPMSGAITSTATIDRYDSNPAGTADSPPAAPEAERVYSGGTATTGYGTPDASLAKTYLSSSDPNTADAGGGANAKLTLGETVTYELTLTVPQGTADLVLTDALPDGLLAQSAQVVSVGNPVTDTAALSVGDTHQDAGITISGSRDEVRFDFGTLVVAGSADGTAVDTDVVVRVTALVADVAAAQDGATLTNTATATLTDPDTGAALQPGLTASESVDIVEPELEIVKTGHTGADRGDVAPYVITVTNTGSATAYDAAITDSFASPHLTYQTGTVTVTLNGGAIAPAVTEPAPGGSDGFRITGLTLDPGDVVQVSFDARLSATAPLTESIANTASTTYDSVDGTVLDADGAPVGRAGSDDSTHRIASVPQITKTPFGSNLTETDSTSGSTPFELTIGEEVSYRLALTLPEIAMDSVVVTENLPDGLDFVSARVVQVNGTGSAGTVATAVVGGDPRVVSLDFGAMTNAYDGSIGADDVLLVEVVARVSNDGTAAAGDTLTNRAELDVDPAGPATYDTQSATAEVEVVEPALTIDQTGPIALSPGGDPGAFTTTVRNPGAPGAEGPAYDVDIIETLPADLTVDPASISFTDGAGNPIVPERVTLTPTGFIAEFPVLEPGQEIVVSYDASLDAGATPLTTFESTASAEYYSAPDDAVDGGGAPVAEAYAPVANSHLTHTVPTLTKEATGSSLAETPHDADGDGDPEATIGETVTYELVMTLPEIPMDQVVLRDTLPVGLRYLSSTITGIGSEITVGGTSNLATVNAGATPVVAGQDWTLTLADVINTYVDGTITPGADAITVEITALVEDVPSNLGTTPNTQLDNTAGVTVTPLNEPALTEITATETLEVVEPDLAVTKEGNIAVNPGDTVSYTVTTENEGTGPAFDIAFDDPMSTAELTLNAPTVKVFVRGVDVTAQIALDFTGGGLSFDLVDTGTGTPFVLQPGETFTVTYDASLSPTAPEARTFLNDATVTFDNLPGDPVDGAGVPLDGRSYSDMGEHRVATVPFLFKDPTSSSFAETPDGTDPDSFDLAIGEEVTFSYRGYLPEIQMDSVIIRDTLPAGLELISMSDITFGSDMTTLGGGALPQPVKPAAGSQSFVLDLGDILNAQDTVPPTIGLDDRFTFTIVTRVANDQGLRAGDTLTNVATLDVVPSAGGVLNTAVAEADVRVVEPSLSIDKTAPVALSPETSGSFAVTVTNADGGATPTGPAYDVEIKDTIPAGMTLDPTSVDILVNGVSVLLPNGTLPGGVLTVVGDEITLTLDVMLPGDEVQIVYTAELDAGEQPLSSYTQTATADYDSAPGDPLDGAGDPTQVAYATESASATTATLPTLDKTAIATSFAGSAEDADGDGTWDVQVGETVTYELVMTLPEIPMETLTLTDTLPAGMRFVSASVTELGGDVTVGGSTDTAGITSGMSVAQAGQLLTFGLTDVVNAGSDASGTRADDAVVIQVRAVVDDLAGLVQDSQLTNTAGLVIDPEGPDIALIEVTDTETVELVEPALTLVKSGEVAGSPGQDVDYSVTVTNSGKGTAFDAVISDPMTDPALSYVSGSAQVFVDGVLMPVQPTVAALGQGFTLTLDAVDPGAVVRVDFQARIDETAAVAASYPNTASVAYDSAEGATTGRSGSDSDTQAITGGPGLEKTALTSQFAQTSSEAGDTPFELTPGEEVTFRYRITLPELAIDAASLEDQLPAGLDYVSHSIVATNGTGVGAVTVDSSAPGRVRFDLGAFANPSDGSIGADDVLVIDLTARVTSDGSVAAGDSLTNTATLNVDPVGDDPYAPVTDSATVQVVEPSLSLEKTGPSAVDPGDTASFTLTVSNDPGTPSVGPAFDLTVTDTLPADLTLDPASLRYSIGGAPAVPSNVTIAGQTFAASFDLLPAGAVLTVTYDATLSADVEPVSSAVNTASVRYDSVPGDPLDGDGQPVGVTYDPEEDSHVISTGPTLTKTAVQTGFAETPEDGDGDGILGLAVGETVTYDLVVTLPEIAMDQVVITDVLPDGLDFVGAQLVQTGAELTLGAQTLTHADGVITFTVSDLDNAYVDGTISAADQLTLQVTARANDSLSNTDQTQLTNRAGVVVTPEGLGPLDEVVAQDTVEIIEPRLTIEKTTAQLEPFLGDIFTYTLVVTNDASATSPAFNSVVTDELPYELTLTGNVTLSDPTKGTVSAASSAGATRLVVTIPVLQPGESLSIDLEVFTGYQTDVLVPVSNTGAISGGSTPLPNDPNARAYTVSDTSQIVPRPVPDDDDRQTAKAIDGIDDAQFLPVLLIDPIYTGSAEPGSNVTLNLYRADGALDYVRHVVADAGGHWIALFPKVQLNSVFDDFGETYGTSTVFEAPVRLLDSTDHDTMDYRGSERILKVGSDLLDEAYTLSVAVDRPSTLPQEMGLFNARTHFAPTHVGQIYSNQEVLSVDQVFEDIAFRTVEEMYGASVDPLGASLNRFNYEFIAGQTSVPGAL